MITLQTNLLDFRKFSCSEGTPDTPRFLFFPGDSHIKRTGVPAVVFRSFKRRFGSSYVVQAYQFHSGTFHGIELKINSSYSRTQFSVLELVRLRTLRGEKHFKLRPQNKILVPLRRVLASHNAGFGSPCPLIEL